MIYKVLAYILGGFLAGFLNRQQYFRSKEGITIIVAEKNPLILVFEGWHWGRNNHSNP